MNGLSVGELCCLFCCPPFPSQIVAKLAFLPPQPTYNLIVNHDATLSNGEQASLNQSQQNNNPASNANNLNTSGRNNRTSSGIGNFFDLIRNSGRRFCSSLVCAKHNYAHQTGQVVTPPLTNAKIVMKEKAEWQYGPGELEKLEVFLTRTERGHQIACLFVRCTANPKYTILFSHGNAVDIGQMSSFYFGLGSRLECNIFTYDYSGYGASSGTPTEKNLYADIRAAWNALRSRYGVSPSNIILYGQSIGTVPTVDLAVSFFLF